MAKHGASCTCEACMDKDERTFTVWHDPDDGAISDEVFLAWLRRAVKMSSRRKTADDMLDETTGMTADERGWIG